MLFTSALFCKQHFSRAAACAFLYQHCFTAGQQNQMARVGKHRSAPNIIPWRTRLKRRREEGKRQYQDGLDSVATFWRRYRWLYNGRRRRAGGNAAQGGVASHSASRGRDATDLQQLWERICASRYITFHVHYHLPSTCARHTAYALPHLRHTTPTRHARHISGTARWHLSPL